jgi:hypothetical protein
MLERPPAAILPGMQRTNLNLSLDLELLDGELHGRCHDGNGGDRRFSGWLGLIGAIDSFVVAQAPGSAGRAAPPSKTKGTEC